jgi:CSLREA domain-containing protein
VSIRSFKRAHAQRVARERRRIDSLKRRSALLAGTTLTASALIVSNAEAASNTYTVTGTGDTPVACTGSAPNLQCTTLREAITEANANGAGDTIDFQSGLTGTITLGSALPITDAGGLTINGPGAGSLKVSGNNATQIFNITAPSAASVAISGLTLDKGNSGSTPGGAIKDLPASGEAAPLTLTNDVVSGSTSAATTNSGGGGIYSRGPVTISGSTITGNTAPNGYGGGIEVEPSTSSSSNKYDLTITDSTISGNTALSGGGIFGSNNLIVTGSHITGNHATSGSSSNGNGGGIYRSPYSTLESTTTITNTAISGNTATNNGGGVFAASKYGTTILNSSITGNTANRGGGAELAGLATYPQRIAKYNPTTIKNTTISGNAAVLGAGVDVIGAGGGNPVKIVDSTISGNHGQANSFGGGLLVDKYVYSSVDVTNSTISGNTATHGGGVSLSYGGSTRPLLVNGRAGSGSIGFQNSTIAGNAAAASGGGGGIYLAQYKPGSSTSFRSGKADLNSTIVAGNTAAGAAQDLARPATSTSGGFDGAFSLVQSPAGAPFLSSHAMIEDVSPQLGTLGNHGGPTQTMVPSGTSPVIDQGHAEPGTTDQRGDPRTINVPGMIEPPGGDGTDIGSVELPVSAVVVPRAGLSATIRGKLLGGPKTLLLAGSSTPVKCSVRIGTLASCIIEVKSSGGKLLADGAATTSASTTSLSVTVTLTDAGRTALANRPLGMGARAVVNGSTSRSGTQTVSGNVHLLAGPSITLSLGKRSRKLSKGVLGELSQVAKLLSGARSITCTAYSDKGKGDASLTLAQAKAACSALTKDGFKGKVKAVGKGHSNAIAPVHSKKNRRLVITFSF